MNTKILLAIALSVVSINASAASSNFEGFYIGASASALKLDAKLKSTDPTIKFSDGDSTSLGVNLGYGTVNGSFYVGAEAALRNNYGKAEDSTGLIKVEGKQGWDLSILPGYLINQTTLIYGRIGITSINGEMTIPVLSLSGSEDMDGMICGLGLQKAFTENLSGKIEYTHVTASKSFNELGGYKIEGEATGASVGIQYTF